MVAQVPWIDMLYIPLFDQNLQIVTMETYTNDASSSMDRYALDVSELVTV